jgi:hypothetical protein
MPACGVDEMANGAGPEMSVIVTVVDGGAALDRCLAALTAQTDAPRLEIIVPYDDDAAGVAGLRPRFPAVRFMDLGRLAAQAPRNEYEKHDLYDRRRAAGLHAASAPLIAMIEDRGAPRPDWARAMADAQARFPDAAIGGAVENEPTDLARWAIFFVDFSRYQAPFDTLHPEYVTDTNICYKREALLSVAPLWAEKYQESAVNWALRDRGFSLRLDPGPRTVQLRAPIGVVAMAGERFNWGRVYGEQRARNVPFAARLKWMAATPLLPFVLLVRHLGKQMRVGRHVGTFIAASPIMFFLLSCWALGELQGYRDAARGGAA